MHINYSLLLIEIKDFEEAKITDKVTEINQNFAPAYYYKATLTMLMTMKMHAKIMRPQLI